MTSPVQQMTADVSNSPLVSSRSRSDLPAVSVIIVVWNAKKYVLECLESLREYCQHVYDEVIIVDNASIDGTPELIAEMFPEFKLIRNLENLGFAKANNIGMEQCSGDYVCLVNSDVKFTSDCLSPLLKFLSENPEVGMVGPKMLLPDGRVARSTMRFPTVWNQFCRAVGLNVAFKKSRLFGGYLMSDFNHQTTSSVEVLNGWFVVVSRTALDRVGVLDPQFFMYGEDVRLVLSVCRSRAKGCFLCRSRCDSLRWRQFIECAASFLPGTVLRQLAILAKTSRLAGDGLSR